jgi:hypothetical protein
MGFDSAESFQNLCPVMAAQYFKGSVDNHIALCLSEGYVSTIGSDTFSDGRAASLSPSLGSIVLVTFSVAAACVWGS